MRLAVAVLLVLSAVGSAGAQGTAQGTQSKSDEVLRQRLLLKERFNKGWDVQVENSQDRIEGRCKAEARKRYSAIHPLKRRAYVKDCIARKGR